jgi:hypothetical protein
MLSWPIVLFPRPARHWLAPANGGEGVNMTFSHCPRLLNNLLRLVSLQLVAMVEVAVAVVRVVVVAQGGHISL